MAILFTQKRINSKSKDLSSLVAQFYYCYFFVYFHFVILVIEEQNVKEKNDRKTMVSAEMRKKKE